MSLHPLLSSHLVPAPLQLGVLNCSQGDRLVSLIFAQTLPSPSWQLIKLLEPSLESEHGRPVPGAPSGEMHIPGSLRMGRHRISHCCSWGRGLASLHRLALLPCRDAQGSIQLLSVANLAKAGRDPVGSGPAPGAGAAAAAGPAQPFLLPLTPHSTARTCGQYCPSLLPPGVLRHQCFSLYLATAVLGGIRYPTPCPRS